MSRKYIPTEGKARRVLSGGVRDAGSQGRSCALTVICRVPYRDDLKYTGVLQIQARPYSINWVPPMPTKIAIVDDHPTIRKVIRSFIQSNTDWEVCGEAGDGEAAITVAVRLNPDLIVLDLSMPVMNGLDAARAIASVCPNSQMVLFTAHSNNQLMLEAERVGIRAVLPKDGSNSLDQLLSVLRQVCHNPHAA
jgi:CheY-like chemotaxis protein